MLRPTGLFSGLKVLESWNGFPANRGYCGVSLPPAGGFDEVACLLFTCGCAVAIF